MGPRLAVQRDTTPAAHAVGVTGEAHALSRDRPLVLTIRVDGLIVGRHRIGRSGEFAARLPLAAPLAPGPHTVEIEASQWFVPDRFQGNGDFRPLAWRLGEVELEAEDSACRPPRGPGA